MGWGSYMETGHLEIDTQHKKIHRAFERQLSDLVDGYQEGTLDLSIKVLDLLQDWNPMHILTEDQELVDFFGKQPTAPKG